MEQTSNSADHPTVIVLGYSESSMLLRRPDRPAIGAVISIHGQREFPIEAEGIARRLVLGFDDIEAEVGGDRVAAWQREKRLQRAREMGLDPKPPERNHAEAIVEFARSIGGMSGAMLCQCQGGISRSPAAALLTLAAWTGPGWEAYCVSMVRAARPAAMPHPDMVRFGDEVLGRGGALVGAVERIGR